MPQHAVSESSALDLDEQWWLIPQDPDLLVNPTSTLGLELYIEFPHQSGEDEPHLVVCEIPSNAVPGPKAEGFVDASTIMEVG